MSAQLVDTTVGRALLAEMLPKQLYRSSVGKPMTKKAISVIADHVLPPRWAKETVIFADQLMYTGLCRSDQGRAAPLVRTTSSSRC